VPAKRVLQGGAALVLAALVLLLAVAVRGSVGGGSFAADIRDGERPTAPDFSLPDLDGGESLSLASLRGRPVVVNFWASWCPPCQDEAPLLQQIAAEEGAGGVEFVGVTYNDTSDDARAFARRYGLSYRLVRDGDDRVSRAWGVTGPPETFVLDADGRAVAHFYGAIDASPEVTAAFRRAIDDVRRS
jgi:cytochrome c biogenesis protein CcmG/thiol:disulfide interchange protein DsbE